MSDFPVSIVNGDAGHLSHHELLATLFDLQFTQGALASRPAAGVARRTFFATDTKQWFRDDGAAWQQILTAEGSTELILNDPATWVDLRANGAVVGGGDCSAAWAATITALSNGGRILLPAGDLTFASSIVPVTGLTVEGVGTGSNGGTPGTRLIYTGSTNAVAAVSGGVTTGVTFRDLAIKCTQSGANGVNLPNTTDDFLFENVAVYGASPSAGKGVYGHGQGACSCHHEFFNVWVTNFGTCWKLSGDSNAWVIMGGGCGTTNTWAIDISNDGTDTKAGAQNLFIRHQIGGGTVNGINIANNADGNCFIKVIEDSTTLTGSMLTNNGAGTLFISVKFDTGAGGTFTNGDGTAQFIGCLGTPSGYANHFRDLRIGGGDVVLNTGQCAINATSGFTYIPTINGTPTGVPTGHTGTVPMVFDTNNKNLWVYVGGAWIKQPGGAFA